MSNTEQQNKVRQPGFIAALDQSGGSTPAALARYGVPEDSYGSEEEMFDLVHEMRCRIMRSPAFSSDFVFGAILFEQTMERDVDGMPTARHLWERRGIVPFLKVDEGLAGESGGMRLMKPVNGLSALLERGVERGVFGTKMRSVIDAAVPEGIDEIVAQQFEIADAILDRGLVPIIEPEVTISISDKAEAEGMLRDRLLARLDALPEDRQVMFKLTLPEDANHYRPLVVHPRTLRVVALSGGYSRAEANDRLAQNAGVAASFSRALVEGLSAAQSDEEFDRALGESVASIHAASVAG